MNVTFTVSVELRRESGKFAGRDEIVEALRERLEEAVYDEVSSVGADGDSVYVIDDYAIEEVVAPKRRRKESA